jgi:hypothetical protein
MAACAALAVLAAGCGSSSTSSSTPAAQTGGGSPAGGGTATSAGTSTGGGTSSGGGSTSGPGALSAEATSVATGDIPDNQMFLTYTNPAGHYAFLYPEGWAIKAHGADVTIQDKNNIVRVVVTKGGPPTPATLAAELSQLKATNPTLTFSSPATLQVKAGPAVKAVYTTQSTPNPVTGKTVLLIVDRYELSKAGERATVDLGTAKGVDNVDAYRRMINSFHWL